MKLLATLLAMGQSYEEPIFGRPTQAKGPVKKTDITTCLEKFGPLSLENVQVNCNETPKWGKGYCHMQRCNDGYIKAKRSKKGTKVYCYTDATKTKVWWSEIPYTCNTCSLTMKEIKEMIHSNRSNDEPKMQIKITENESMYAIGSMSFKCGAKSRANKNRVLPFGWNAVPKVQCKCDSVTGECNWQHMKRKFDIGDNWDFSNWHCHKLNFDPTGNHKIPAGLRCKNEDRVFGGENASKSNHPWLIHISARSAKINEDGEITASLAWKNCQGVLIDPKTVVTTADCATYMPYTMSSSFFGWTIHEHRLYKGDTSLGPDALYDSLKEAVEACESLPRDDCTGISVEQINGFYKWIPRSEEGSVNWDSWSWSRPSSTLDGSNGYEYEISAGHDDKKSFLAQAPSYYSSSIHQVTNHIQRLVSTLDGSHQKIFIHPDANLAVLKLNEPFEMNSKIATACLPTLNQTLPPETPCYFAAWGMKHKGWSNPGSNPAGNNGGSTRRLRETDLPILTDEECKASGWYSENNPDTSSKWYWFYEEKIEPKDFADFDNQFCAGHKDKNGIYDAQHGVAPGDDGAPLICVVDNKPLLMGAAIYADSSFHFPNFPNLFTSVPKQVEWIQQVMQN